MKRTYHEFPIYRTQTEPSLYYYENGVPRWKSSNNPIPRDLLKEYGIEVDWDAYEAARAADLRELREAMKNYVPSDEEVAEMNAAFGPGERIVNAITGEVIHTTK